MKAGSQRTAANMTMLTGSQARLYAESGKFEKAKEIASLLSDGDKAAVLDYIKSLQ